MGGKAMQFDADVLVVDDLIVGRELAKEMLELMGCRVDTAESGEEALRMLEQKEYAIAFLDIQMPGMDGFDTAKNIRHQLGDKKKMPLVAFSANVTNGAYRIECLEHGIDDCLSKPIQYAQLESVLKKHVA